MARVTVEECLDFVQNRFELVLVAAKRAHQLNSGGYKSTLNVGKDKASVVALREIEAGLIDASILNETYKYEIKEGLLPRDKVKMAEIEAELSTTAIDGLVDEISEATEL